MLLIRKGKTMNSWRIRFDVIFIGDLIRIHTQNLLKCLKLVQTFGVRTLIFLHCNSIRLFPAFFHIKVYFLMVFNKYSG